MFDANREAFIRVANIFPDDVKINKGEIIAVFEPVVKVTNCDGLPE